MDTKLLGTLLGDYSVEYVDSFAFHPTHKVIALGIETTVKLFRFSEQGHPLEETSSKELSVDDDGHRDVYGMMEEDMVSEYTKVLVRAIAFHPTLPLMLTGLGDCSVRLCNISDNGEHILTCNHDISKGNGAITCVAFHPALPFFIAAGDNNTAKMYKYKYTPGSHVHVSSPTDIIGQHSEIFSVAFHPAEPLVLIGSSDNTAKLWRFSPESGGDCAVVGSIEHSSPVISCSFHSPFMMTASTDGTIRVSLVEGIDRVKELSSFKNDSRIYSAAFHPIFPIIIIGSSDGIVTFCKFSEDGKRISRVMSRSDSSPGRVGSGVLVTVHPTLDYCATNYRDSVRVWDIRQLLPKIMVGQTSVDYYKLEEEILGSLWRKHRTRKHDKSRRDGGISGVGGRRKRKMTRNKKGVSYYIKQRRTKRRMRK
jgi:WD40 repeat protein